MRYLNKISLLGLVMLLNSAAFPLTAEGEMTSSDYYIYADSVGFNGGLVSTSTNYTLTDTIGDLTAGPTTSTTYSLVGGFQAANLDETLSLLITDSILDLGTLNRTLVSAATTSVVVGCNATAGYTVSVTDVSGTITANVSDGEVTAGSDEYGVSASGDGAAFGNDQTIANNLIVASANTDVVRATTTLAFKASYNVVSAGTYNQAVILTASGNF